MSPSIKSLQRAGAAEEIMKKEGAVEEESMDKTHDIRQHKIKENFV